MYPLLSLQVFKLRHKLDSIQRRKGDHSNELIETVTQIKKIVETISKEAKQLFDAEEIDGEDLHKILIANANLFEYLNNKYSNQKDMNEEVYKMTRTLYDPAVELRGIEKGIEKGEDNAIKISAAIIKGMDVEQIAEKFNVTIEKVNKIKQQLGLY